MFVVVKFPVSLPPTPLVVVGVTVVVRPIVVQLLVFSLLLALRIDFTPKVERPVHPALVLRVAVPKSRDVARP